VNPPYRRRLRHCQQQKAARLFANRRLSLSSMRSLRDLPLGVWLVIVLGSLTCAAAAHSETGTLSE